jgi:hypothetical protein
MADYVCVEFPDDDKPLDSFIVGLISIAIALPVASFCQTCFAIANNSEAPESWLEWVGWRKLVFGFNAHRKWHYTKRAQPVRHVKWFIRSIGAPQTETAMNLWVSFKCWLTCVELPWIVEAREAEEQEAAGADQGNAKQDDNDGTKPANGAGSEKAASTSSSVRSARLLSRYKRSVMAIGLVGIYVCWAIFTWCVRPCSFGASVVARAPSLNTRRALHTPSQVYLRVRHAHLQVAGRRRAAVVRAQLGHQLWAERGVRMARYPHRSGQGRAHPGHPGAAVPHAAEQLA